MVKSAQPNHKVLELNGCVQPPSRVDASIGAYGWLPKTVQSVHHLDFDRRKRWTKFRQLRDASAVTGTGLDVLGSGLPTTARCFRTKLLALSL